MFKNKIKNWSQQKRAHSFADTVRLGYDYVSLGNLKEHSALIIEGLEVWDAFLDIYTREDEGAPFRSKHQKSFAQWHGIVFPKIDVLNLIVVATYNLRIRRLCLVFSVIEA